MEGFDMKKITEMIRAAGGDPSDLEKTAEFIQQLGNEEQIQGTFAAPIKNIKGLTVPVLIRTIEDKINKGNGKTRYEYRLLIGTFEDVVVPSELGEKLSDTEISLKLDRRIKMSYEERTAYLAAMNLTWNEPNPPNNNDIAHTLKKPLEDITPGVRKAFLVGLPLKDDGYASKRLYFSERDESVILNAGSEIKITSFDGPFSHSNNMPFRELEFAVCKGLCCEEKFDEPNQPSTYGKQWKVQDKTGKLEEDPSRGPADVKRMLHILSHSNKLLNVGENGALYDIENESPTDTAFRQEKENSGKEMKNWEKDAILLGKIPEPLRSVASQVIVIPLQGTETDPEFAIRATKVIVKAPRWNKEFVGKKSDDTPVKIGSFQAKCRVVENDVATDALVQMQLFDKHMIKFGVMDFATFGKIASFFVPKCRGYIAGRMDVGGSHSMDESSMAFNKQNEDGTWPKKVAFGVFSYAELLNIDLASGVISGGFHITPECVRAAMEMRYKSSDFSVQSPQDVESYAQINPLNTGGKPPIINLFESLHSLQELTESYQFFLVCNRSNQSDEVKEVTEKLEKKFPDSVMEKMSELIMGKPVKGVTGWPVKLRGDEFTFTIFAVRNNVAEETLEVLNGPAIKDEAAFVAAYIAAQKKRKTDDARRQIVADEIASLHDLPAGTFDDEPADQASKRQKTKSQTKAKGKKKVEDPMDIDQEDSDSQVPKRRRSRKAAAAEDIM